jgi:cyclopropane fatty-acyl-phospholipid synthase-like methyltransferase
MSALPLWAQSQKARELLAQIVSDPDLEVLGVPSGWGGQCDYRYQSKAARQLRVMRRREQDRLIEAHSRGEIERDDVLAALEPDADRLIERLLSEQALQAKVTDELAFTIEQQRAA